MSRYIRSDSRVCTNCVGLPDRRKVGHVTQLRILGDKRHAKHQGSCGDETITGVSGEHLSQRAGTLGDLISDRVNSQLGQFP